MKRISKRTTDVVAFVLFYGVWVWVALGPFVSGWFS